METLTKRIVLTTLAVLLTMAGFAQQRGTLRGLITDETGNALPGATVVIKGTTIGSSTDLNGNYLIQAIPVGTVDVTVDYLGYQPVTEKVKIEHGKTAIFDLMLKQNAMSIDGVIVTAAVDGQQRALNQQRAADNLTQVISADQMGRFPDLNVADALRRLSGVTSDGSNISLRGTPTNFTNITVNGEQMMGTQEFSMRSASLDVIPSDILASMEVQKTLMPSNDGDAIAGVINLRTSTARTLKPSFKFDVGSGYNFLREKGAMNLKGAYAQRFSPSRYNKNGVFGISANYSYFRSFDGYDRLESEAWVLTEKIYDPASPSSVIQQNVVIPNDHRYRYQTRETTRQGGTLTVDWAPSVNTKLIWSTIFNTKFNDATRYRNRFQHRGKVFYMGEDTYGFDRVRYINQTTAQKERNNNFNTSLEGETTAGNWKLDASGYYNRSGQYTDSEAYDFRSPDWRANDKDITLPNGSKVKYPNNTILGTVQVDKYLALKNPEGLTVGTTGLPLSDESFMVLYQANHTYRNTTGENATWKANATLNYFIKEYASAFSFGFKGKYMMNDGLIPARSAYWTITPVAGVTEMSNFIQKQQLDKNWLNGNAAFGPSTDLDKVRAFMNNPAYAANRVSDDMRASASTYSDTYTANEYVHSAYVMNKTQINKLMVLAGVRAEYTRTDYDANMMIRTAAGAVPDPSGEVSFDNYERIPVDSMVNYVKLMPNLQFKYELQDNTIVRLAYTTGYSRPNVFELVPRMDATNDPVNRVTMGNPELKPAYAHNIDLLGEHYMKNVGLLSAGLFYKHINKFQYIVDARFPDATPQDLENPYHGWNYQQTRNGDAAKVYGVEVTLNSNLTFLPGFLKNLVFTSNYTFVHSQAYASAARETMRLPGQADHTANLALAYSCERFSLQAAANYNGSYIVALGADNTGKEDQWRNARWQIDLNGSLTIVKGLNFWVEATNILNAESYTYVGDNTRVFELQYNGVYGRAGFTYRF